LRAAPRPRRAINRDGRPSLHRTASSPPVRAANRTCQTPPQSGQNENRAETFSAPARDGKG